MKYFEPPGAMPWTLKRAKRQAEPPAEVRDLLDTWHGVKPGQVANPPRISEQRRSDPKADHVGERIELLAELRVRPGQPRHSAVERIKQDRQANGFRCVVERIGLLNGAEQRGYAGIVAAQQVAHSEQAGNQKNSAAKLRIPDPRYAGRKLGLFGVRHQYV